MSAETMRKWHAAAANRSSVRSYAGNIPKDLFYSLKDFAKSLDNGDARIELRTRTGVLERPALMSLFGGVSGTNTFGAVIVRDENKFMGGYIGETFVLECVARGLGTCWLGGAYHKTNLKRNLQLDSDESLLCVIAVGKALEIGRPAEKKSIQQLTGLMDDEFAVLPDWQKEAVKTAQMSPSALNKQPWKLEFERDYVRLINTKRNFGFGDVDCGIAMLHIEIGAASCGIYGDWLFDGEDGEARFVPFKKLDRIEIDN